MYLSKNASGIYYTHLPLPKSLRDRGLPFAIRTSLCTKDRRVAVDRNLAVAARPRALIAATPDTDMRGRVAASIDGGVVNRGVADQQYRVYR